MKGIVFCAFVSFVEQEWSDDVSDQILQQCNLNTGGSYTSVGYYQHSELTQLSQSLAERSNSTANVIMRRFGEFLFPLLAQQAEVDMKKYISCFDLLVDIETVIHRDVRHLNPAAEVPMIKVLARDGENSILLEYRSSRPFAMMAEGLFLGALTHFQMDQVARFITLERSPDNTYGRFRIEI